MKRGSLYILFAFIFMTSFVYLHQKVQLYVEAYKLSQNYQSYKELVDKRDYLVYNFSKEFSLSKVNEWAQENSFRFAEKEVIMAMNMPDKDASLEENKVAFLFDRFLNVPSRITSALAGN